MSQDTGRARLPALPMVNAQDLSLRNWISAVNERLEVREGSRGNPAERVVTQRELDLLTSKLQVLQTAPTARAGQTLIPLGGGMHAAIDVNAFADALRSTRLYRDLMSRIDDPTRFDTLNQQVKDVLLSAISGESSKRSFEVLTESRKRIQSLADEAVARAEALETEAVNRANAIQDEASTRAQSILDEALARSNGDGALQQQINLLSAAGSGNFGDLIAAVEEESTARIAGDAAEATARQTLATQFRGAYTGTDITQVTTGLFNSERTARSSADSAIASDVTALSSTVTNNLATVNAAITEEATTRANADTAEATERSTLQSKMIGAANPSTVTLASLTTGLLYDERTARSTADSTEVTARQLLSTKMVGATDPTGTTLANVTSGLIFDERTTRSSETGALATRTSTLESTVNNVTTGVLATANALDVVETLVNNGATGVTATASKTSLLQSRLDRVVNYRVQAQGNLATIGERGFFSEAGAAIQFGSRSYNLVVLNGSSGAVISSQSYDVFGFGEVGGTAATLAAALNALGSDKVVVVYTADEPQRNRLTSGLPEAMYRCGASRVIFGGSTFQFRSAYILVGIPGIGEGMGVEKYVGAITDDPGAWVDYQLQLVNGRPVGLGGNPLAAAVQADASALTTTNTNVTNLGGVVTAQGTRVTNLETSVNNATTGLSTKASVAYVDTAKSDAISASATSIQKLSAELGPSAFSTLRFYGFDGTVDGWAISGATQSVSAGILTLTATTNDPVMRRYLAASERFNGSAATIVRARVRCLGLVGSWQGTVYYGTSGHSESPLFYKAISAPINPQSWNTLEWDMVNLSVGGTDWVDNQVQGLRLDLSNSSGPVWEIDWIAVGNLATSPISAAIQTEASTRVSADEALASRATTLESKVNDPTTGLSTKASVADVAVTYASLNSAQAVKVTHLEASLGNYYQDGGAGRALLEDTLTTVADDVTGLQAQRTIKVSAGGAMAGIGLAATEPVAGVGDSAIIMVANKLAFVTPSAVIGTGPGEIDPSNPDTSLVPFGVDANGVYINGQVRINASGPLLDSFSSGVDGKSTYAAPVYKRSASALTAPTGGSFNFATNALTPPSGWSVSPPTGTDPIYVTTTTFSVIGQTATVAAGTWSAPVIYAQNGTSGTSGVSTFLYPVFKRSATVISTAPTGGQYNFGTNTGTPPSTWSNTVPSGTDPIYTSTAIASAPGATGTTTNLTWSAPTVLAQNGAKGDTGTGTTGPRGSITGYGATYGLYYSSSWADASVAVSTYRANRVIQNMLLGQSLTTDLTTNTHLRIGDTVTLGNAATPTAVITKYWSGSGWVSPGVIIDGNLLVNGSVSATKIDTKGLTIKDDGGAVIFSAGVPLSAGNVSGLGDFATLDKITSANVSTYIASAAIGSAYIGDLSAAKITSGTMSSGRISFAGTNSYLEVGPDRSSNVLKVARTSGSTIEAVCYIYDTGNTTMDSLWAYHGAGGAGAAGYFYGTSTIATLRVNNSNTATSSAGAEIQGYHGARFKNPTSSAKAVVALNVGAGSKCFYAEAGTFGPFTGSHDAVIPKGQVFTPGDIVVDAECIYRRSISDTLFRIEPSSAPMQPGVVGVFTWQGPFKGFVPAALTGDVVYSGQADENGNLPSSNPPVPEYAAISAAYDNASFNALGEGQINVCGEGGDLAPGDFITSSSIPGKGMKQPDDLVHGYTVAKCREAVMFLGPDEIKQVACIYLAG